LVSSSAATIVSVTIIEKIIVVANHCVPIKTGFAVALKVLPAPSFSSGDAWLLEIQIEAVIFLMMALIFGTSSIKLNS